METKVFNHKRYYRYEYHGKKIMPLSEAEEGMKHFRKMYSRDFAGKTVATIRKHKEAGGYSLWHHDGTLLK